MSLARAELPTDPTALRAFALACQDELRAAELAVQYKTLEIEKLKFQIAKLRWLERRRGDQGSAARRNGSTTRLPSSNCGSRSWRQGKRKTAPRPKPPIPRRPRAHQADTQAAA